MCTFRGCNKPSAHQFFFKDCLDRYGLQGIKYDIFANAFSGACAEHCTWMARGTAARAGILDPRALEAPPQQQAKSKQRQTQPTKYYPSDYASRRRRLAEIEASMRKSTVAERHPYELYQRDYQPVRQPQRKPRSNRRQMFDYLTRLGLDPTKVGNI